MSGLLLHDSELNICEFLYREALECYGDRRVRLRDVGTLAYFARLVR